MLTDETGAFDFPNLKPGLYQLRAQVLGGATWCDGGKIFFARSDMPDAELAKLKAIDFRLAPFKKGFGKTTLPTDFREIMCARFCMTRTARCGLALLVVFPGSMARSL
jgi:hypothetical protein